MSSVSPQRSVPNAVETDIGGRTVKLSHLDRVLWPGTALTKGWLIGYYATVAPVLLPHLAGHPVTLHRFPEGIGGDHFFQTRVPPHPNWVRTVTMRPVRTGKVFDVAVLDDLAGLVWAANLGTIELHPYLARAEALGQPRFTVFDLDPGLGVGMLESCRVALWLRAMLADMGLAAFAKTSGAKGVHVYVPVNGGHTYSETKAFARAVAALLTKFHPSDVVDTMTKSRRVGKVLVDWSQNDAGKSTVSPYSLRGQALPTASVPLGWDEIEEALAANEPRLVTFLARDALDRIERHGDVFAPVATLKQRLPKIVGGAPGP